MKIKLFILQIILLVNTSLIVYSQKQDDPKTTNGQKNESAFDNLVLGGNIGLQIGTITYIEISPLAGYYFNPKLMGGTGLTYQYYKESGYVNTVGTSIYGGRVYFEYTFLDKIGQAQKIKANYGVFSHIEYEALNLDRDFNDNLKKVNRFWLQGILIGGGVKQSFGKHSSFNITLLYNLNANNRTPYTNPIVRVGFYL